MAPRNFARTADCARGPRSGARTGLTTCIFAGIALAACTRVSDTQPFPLVSERLTIVRTIPEPDAVIAPDVQIDVCFSGYVDPRAVDDFDVSVSSGAIQFDVRIDLQLFAWRPPGAAVGDADSAWCPGSVLSIRPRAPLRPGLRHRFRMQPSAVGWAGEKLDVTTPGWVQDEAGPAFLVEFTVDPEAKLPADGDTDTDTDGTDPDTDTDGGAEPPAPALGDLFAPGQVFAADNPACSCHRGAEDDDDDDALARDRLDLSDPDAAFAGLVLPNRVMSTGFLMVAPRRPAESYLVQVLLRDAGGHALLGVLGEPMPPDEPLAYADMVALVRWIEGGARR
ncbi:MAG: hypothetical protein H0T76_20135 [Nannocystis sp.]|nr:hypothetical protein [Nannocystis sp.]MBA3548798.1 hypothetical protein [Nannocystis sp.]